MYSSFPFTVAGLMLDRELDNHLKKQNGKKKQKNTQLYSNQESL